MHDGCTVRTGYVFCGTQVRSISVVQRALFLFMLFKTLQYGNRKKYLVMCVCSCNLLHFTLAKMLLKMQEKQPGPSLMVVHWCYSTELSVLHACMHSPLTVLSALNWNFSVTCVILIVDFLIVDLDFQLPLPTFYVPIRQSNVATLTTGNNLLGRAWACPTLVSWLSFRVCLCVSYVLVLGML